MTPVESIGEPVIRLASLPDVPAIVRLHQAEFKGLFLAEMGPRFLRHYYEAFLAHPEGIGHVADREGRVVGFVVGTLREAAYRAAVRKRRIPMALASLARVATRPALLPRIIGRFTSMGSDIADPIEAQYLRDGAAHLVSLAVSSAWTGTGVGTRLVRAFEDSVLSRGQTVVYLTTAADGNEPANRFYRSLGYELAGTRLDPDGTRVNQYIRKLSATPSAE